MSRVKTRRFRLDSQLVQPHHSARYAVMTGPCRRANAPCVGGEVMTTRAYISMGYART
jgi:hypothetical protein